MPYIPVTITHLASQPSSNAPNSALFAYTNTVSGGQAQPDGVKSITAGYGVGGGGSSGAVALTSTGIQTITAGSGVSVSTSGALTTLTATGGGATSGTSVRYATFLNNPVTFLPNASTVLCTLNTPTTNNYAEVSVGFVPAQPNPYVAPVIVPSGGPIGLGIYLSPSPTLTPTIISNCYGSLIAETSAISNIPFILPDVTGQSTYPANALYLSAVSPTPVSTWYVVASNFQGSAPYIGADTCQKVMCSLYANNITSS